MERYLSLGWTPQLETNRFVSSVTQLRGAENELFVDPKTSMRFGDAKQSLINLRIEVKAA